MSLFGIQTIVVEPGQTELGVINVERKQIEFDTSAATGIVYVDGLDGTFVQPPEELQYCVLEDGLFPVVFRHLAAAAPIEMRINCPGQIDRVMTPIGSVSWFVRKERPAFGWTNGDDQ